MAQQYYTIESTAVYRSADGSLNLRLVEGEQIPMELAIDLGLDGAALAEGEFFDAATRAAIDLLVPRAHPEWRTGLYYGNDTSAGASVYAAGVIPTNFIYAAWCAVPHEAPVDRIGVEITTNVADKHVRAAIFAPDGTQGYPGSLIVQSAELSAASLGDVTDTIAETLSAGGVWLALQGDDSTIAVRQISASGRSSVVGKTSIGGTAAYGVLRVAFTYGAFPDTFPAGAVPQASSPVINVRAA